MAALSNLLIRFTLTSIDPLIDNVSMDFSYFTTFVTQDINDVSDLTGQIAAKFNSIPASGTASPASYLSRVMSKATNKLVAQVYDVTTHLNGTPHGSPVLISAYNLGGTPVASVMPEGVCATVTLQAPYGSDVEFLPNQRPRARDRGRIYFGPLNTTAMTEDTTSFRCKLTPTFCSDMTKWIKGINVLTSATHTVVWNLAVWSRKNAAMKSLIETWVDDRPDYQRRRTDQSSVRTILGLP